MKVERSWYWPDFIKMALVVGVCLAIALAAREVGFTKAETIVIGLVAFVLGFLLGRRSVRKRYDDYDVSVGKREGDE
jgi:hypothetical protein